MYVVYFPAHCADVSNISHHCNLFPAVKIYCWHQHMRSSNASQKDYYICVCVCVCVLSVVCCVTVIGSIAVDSCRRHVNHILFWGTEFYVAEKSVDLILHILWRVLKTGSCVFSAVSVNLDQLEQLCHCYSTVLRLVLLLCKQLC